MEIKAFLIRFEKTLCNSGFSPEAARHHTLKVAKGLSDSDKKRIRSFETDYQVDVIARNYASRLRRKNVTASSDGDTMSNTATITSNFRESIPSNHSDDIKVYPSKHTFEDKSAEKSDEAEAKTMTFSSVKNSGFQATSQIDENDDVKTVKIDAVRVSNKTVGSTDSDNTNSKTKNISKVPIKKNKLSPEAKKEFTKQLAVRSPMFILGFAGAGIGAFAVYALIALLIAAFIALLVAVIVVGGVGTLAGLIYGIIKIFSIMSEGLYEIGFSLVVAGVTIALSICSYNVAVRVIPILWRKFTFFLTDCLNKFKTYIRKIRKECADK